MNYVEYVVAAYAVFVVVLAWDFLATRLQIRRELRNARQRSRRVPAAASASVLASESAERNR